MESRRTALLAMAILVVLGSCGGGSEEPATASSEPVPVPTAPTVAEFLITGDFEQVCGGGTIAAATPYEKSKGVHPLLAFAGVDPEYEELTLDFPEGWATDVISPQETELVACLAITSDKTVKTCKGYESDDNPDETFSIELHNAVYDVTLYEAVAGKVVAEGTVATDDKECPYFAFFDEGEKTQIDYSDPSAQLRSLVKKYVAP